MVSSPLRSRLYLLLHCIVCGIGPVLEPTSAQAQGGPPLLTDDPGTPGNRHWEVNLAGTVEHTAETSLYEAPLDDSENQSALLLPVELTIRWGGLGINGEAGYRIIDGGDDEVIYGLALGH